MKDTGKYRLRTVSIKWRVVLYLLLFATIIINALWLLQSVFLDDIYMKIKTGQIEDDAGEVYAMLTDEDYDGIRRLSRLQKTCIFIYDLTKGDEIISSEGVEGRCELHRLVYTMNIYEFEVNVKNVKALADEADKNNGAVLFNVNSKGIHHNEVQFSTEFKRNDSEQSALYVFVGNDDREHRIVTMLNTVISPMEETVGTLNTMLWYISIVLLILALLFGWIISYLVSKPLLKLNDKAKELAKGNYSVNFEGEGYSEVSTLADTLNYASSQLSKLDTLRSELIANISHDLRTPITLISGYAETMKDIPSEMTAENLQIIIDESERMASLVNQVLDFSRLQSGNANFEMERFQLTECIEGELNRYAKLRGVEGYFINFRYDCRVYVKGDSAKLMQALYNLVNNGVVHSGKDKTVTVVQTIHENRVRISVKDSGEGIPPELLSTIWDRYYKVKKNLNRNQSGNGLGLSIVKAIIEAHHGICGVDSTLGKGSSFFFELDICE